MSRYRSSSVESRHAATWPRDYGAARQDGNGEWNAASTSINRATGTLNRDEVGAKTARRSLSFVPKAIAPSRSSARPAPVSAFDWQDQVVIAACLLALAFLVGVA